VTRRVDRLMRRLERVERRLAAHAEAPNPTGLTEPDPGAEERWDAGQVWAHLAEFPAYWLDQARRIVAGHDAHAPEPVPFGRLRDDPGRVGAIDRDRHADRSELMRRVSAGITAVAADLRQLPREALAARGRHPKLGEMDVIGLFERFVVGHLEEHAAQLDQLRAGEAEQPGR
jgi:hypothetical protein